MGIIEPHSANMRIRFRVTHGKYELHREAVAHMTVPGNARAHMLFGPVTSVAYSEYDLLRLL